MVSGCTADCTAGCTSIRAPKQTLAPKRIPAHKCDYAQDTKPKFRKHDREGSCPEPHALQASDSADCGSPDFRASEHAQTFWDINRFIFLRTAFDVSRIHHGAIFRYVSSKSRVHFLCLLLRTSRSPVQERLSLPRSTTVVSAGILDIEKNQSKMLMFYPCPSINALMSSSTFKNSRVSRCRVDRPEIAQANEKNVEYIYNIYAALSMCQRRCESSCPAFQCTTTSANCHIPPVES